MVSNWKVAKDFWKKTCAWLLDSVQSVEIDSALVERFTSLKMSCQTINGTCTLFVQLGRTPFPDPNDVEKTGACTLDRHVRFDRKCRTVETRQVNNTDAEGRLTLADALLYCQQQGVTEVQPKKGGSIQKWRRNFFAKRISVSLENWNQSNIFKHDNLIPNYIHTHTYALRAALIKAWLSVSESFRHLRRFVGFDTSTTIQTFLTRVPLRCER